MKTLKKPHQNILQKPLEITISDEQKYQINLLIPWKISKLMAKNYMNSSAVIKSALEEWLFDANLNEKNITMFLSRFKKIDWNGGNDEFDIQAQVPQELNVDNCIKHECLEFGSKELEAYIFKTEDIPADIVPHTKKIDNCNDRYFSVKPL